MKRILLFVMTNLAVVAVLGVVASLLGVNRYLTANGLNLGALLGFALVMGFGGAIISLLISKPMAKWSAKVQIIDGSGSADEAWIVETVRKFADKAGIGMPEVGIFEGDPNAFATGAFKNSALVAVSTGLLQGMTRDEVEAVIGHEVAHIANGDMVTLTLIQGVMNTFVVFLSRVIGYVVDKVVLRNTSDGPGVGYIITTIVMDLVLGVLAAMLAIGAWHEVSAYYFLWSGWQALGLILTRLVQNLLSRPGVPKLPDGLLRVSGPLVVLGWLSLARPVITLLLENF